MSKHETYTVVYRTGGTELCTWRQTIDFATREQAQQVAADIERGGRKALVKRSSEVRNIGLPEGWEA